ncbi:hypothetical protein FJT64_008809 [Amphibalanus amphitrite]|uniref:Uncharacterized protein n=1 Tax=Amphibalanus amphitrite TaxID=1232801 RepID=A0A6A4VU01_AMPAM|nr:hypothetical protein FJT64_008809 [Amphibalanus amphitrite]
MRLGSKIPPQPSGATSGRLLTLMQHLAALLQSVHLDRHRQWLWQSERIRRLERTWVGAEESESGAPAPRQLSDLSLVPAELRGALAHLAAAPANCLHIPPALLLSPLSVKLRERVGAQQHPLLGQPVHELLAHADLRGWPAGALYGKWQRLAR